MEPSPLKLPLPEGDYIAYHKHVGKQNSAGVIFLGGFMSDMTGTKATALEAHCREKGISFIRFDYVGHGQSGGAFTEGTIGRWKENVLAVLDKLTEGKQVLIGSSMGGWLMLLAALERPERIRALIGVASAPDFTENLIWDAFSEPQKRIVMDEGIYHLHSEYGDSPYPITRTLIEEGRRHLVLRGTIPITCPVRLLHGMKDDDVPYTLSLDLMQKLQTQDVRLTLTKRGDHRMSGEEEIMLLCSILDEGVT